MELFPTRACADARLPVGRGWASWSLGQPWCPEFRRCAVERQGSFPQGTPLRAERTGGEPRRERWRALLVPRRYAYPLVLACIVQISAKGISVRAFAPDGARCG